ncbi:hypothetical protein PENTCL1PPCAC_11433, partial [Pristionchus entomophagus]
PEERRRMRLIHSEMGNAKSVEVKEKEKEKDKLSAGGSSSKKPSNTNRGSGSLNGSLPKKPLLNASQRSIIKYCLDNAKEDMADRIVRRVGEKKEDFKGFIEALPKEEKQQYVDSLKEFLTLVCNSMMDSEFVQKIGFEYGQKHANLRTKGFKPDFFAGTADAVTTECTFLDGATHAPSETAGAWSELSTFVFSNVRDGYYQELRKQRKNSNTFQSKVKLSEMVQESRDDELNERSHSPGKSGSGELSGSSKEGSPHYVLPPNPVC